MGIFRCSASGAGWDRNLLLVPGRSCSVLHAQVFAADTSTDPWKELELHVGAVNPVVDVELEAERLLTSSWRPSSWQPRSAERRVGKECVSTCSSRGSPYH